jgi:hypothetical protein
MDPTRSGSGGCFFSLFVGLSDKHFARHL